MPQKKLINTFTDRKIKLGFIGCGRISSKHFDALEQHSNDIDVIAVCDKNKEKADLASKRMQSTAYTDIENMLENENLDIITIATPNGIHPENIEKIANKGIHITTEKPLAITYKDGVRALEHCRKNKVELFVVHQNRFNDPVLALWKAIQQNRFGKIYMITSNVFWTRPQDYYDKEGSWHGTKNMDGGAYLTQASHYVDLMQWIAQSEPKQVFAKLRTLARNIETEDTGIASIEWQNGVLGAINVTMLTYPKNLEGSITILGENGTVKIGGVAMNEIEHWEFSDIKPEDEKIKNSNYATNSVYGFGHVRYYENIINVFRGKDEPLINGEEGLKSLKLLDAFYESNELGYPVYFKNQLLKVESK